MRAGRPRVLLAHSTFLSHDAKQTRKMRPYAPLATLLTAAVLRQRGFDVALFDAMLSPGEEEFEELLGKVRPSVVGVLEDNFNFLSKMCTTRSREASLRMIRAAAEAGCRIAVNGSDPTDRPELYHAAGADAVIIGEAEATFLELAEGWSQPEGIDLGTVAGLSLPAGPERSRRTPPRPFVEDLDALPFPAWDLVDIERYRKAWTGAHGRLSWNAVTTRGCPFHCNWCAKPLYGTRYAQRSPGNVAEEMSLLCERVVPGHVWFADDIFGLTPRWIESFAEEIVRRDARIPFTIQSRVDLMTPSAVEALRHAGAEEVWMGVESGSQKILDAMDKGTRVDQVRMATRLLAERGIKPSWFLQLGYPGEEWEDILTTRELIREERPADVGVSVAYPLPGTAFHERVKSQIGRQTNWSNSDDLAMMFQGTFTGPFYKLVRDLLHEEALSAHLEGGRRLSNAHRERLDSSWTTLSELQDTHRSEKPTRPMGLPSLHPRAVGF